MEHLTLDTREREDRDVNERDDQHAEDRRLDHFERCGFRHAEAFVLGQQSAKPVLLHAEAPETILHDDDSAIDDQAEVQCAEAHQIARHLILHHASDRQQHGERDHRRRDQCGADVSEQQEQHDNDEQRAFQKVLLNGLDRAIDKLGAIIDRRRDDTFRQRSRRLLQTLCNSLSHLAAVLAHEHKHRAEHDLAAVLSCRACPQLFAHGDIGDIDNANRHTGAIGDDDALQVFNALSLAAATNEQLLAIAFDIACANVRIVLSQRLDDIVDAETGCSQTIRPRRHVVLTLITADRVDFSDAGRVAELRADDPVLQRAQIFWRPLRTVWTRCALSGFDRVHEDFAEAAGDRPQFGFDALRQLAAY